MQYKWRVSADESLDWGVISYGNVGVRLSGGKRFEPKISEIEEIEKKLEEINEIINKEVELKNNSK